MQSETRLPRISVIAPAYNEGEGIGKVVEKIRAVVNPLDSHHEIIVIDDGSEGETAQKAGARVIWHPYNIGNGAAVKTGIRHARGLIRIFAFNAPYGQTSALLMSTAVLTFLVGLVSEQIAQLRFDRSESNALFHADE